MLLNKRVKLRTLVEILNVFKVDETRPRESMNVHVGGQTLENKSLNSH